MRIKLEENNMDLVMYVVRREGIKIEDAINYLLNNPEIIVNTRGVINGTKTKEKTFKER